VTTARAAWWASALATGLSTYVLEVIATASGVALAATGTLAGLSHGWLVAVLVASYAAWGLGLRVNLRANASLLAETGMSTNVLSKAAYDLTRGLTDSQRAWRWAATTGYVGTEVLKEAPYYAGAFGLAALADPITSSQAVIFLVGSNIGAMLYEYGLARLTRRFLHRRASARVASPRRKLEAAPPREGPPLA
jgi:hypothetical protein